MKINAKLLGGFLHYDERKIKKKNFAPLIKDVSIKLHRPVELMKGGKANETGV